MSIRWHEGMLGDRGTVLDLPVHVAAQKWPSRPPDTHTVPAPAFCSCPRPGEPQNATTEGAWINRNIPELNLKTKQKQKHKASRAVPGGLLTAEPHWPTCGQGVRVDPESLRPASRRLPTPNGEIILGAPGLLVAGAHSQAVSHPSTEGPPLWMARVSGC